MKMKFGRTAAWLIAMTIVAALAWGLRASWADIVKLLLGAKWYLALASVFSLTAGTICAGILFAELTGRGSIVREPIFSVAGVFLVSQVAKYVPGRIWGLAAQATMLRSSVPIVAVVVANVELSVLVLAVAFGVGLACLTGVYLGWLLMFPVLALTFLACAILLEMQFGWRSVRLMTRMFPRMSRFTAIDSDLGARSTRADKSPRYALLASFAAYLALYFFGWCVMALSVAGADSGSALKVVAAISFSYVAGALSMLPGGLGAREGFMVLLGPSIGFSHAEMAALAVGSRSVLLMVDVIATLCGGLLLRRFSI